MKINPRHYPVIIVATFILFLLLALLLGFRPGHGGSHDGGRAAAQLWPALLSIRGGIW